MDTTRDQGDPASSPTALRRGAVSRGGGAGAPSDSSDDKSRANARRGEVAIADARVCAWEEVVCGKRGAGGRGTATSKKTRRKCVFFFLPSVVVVFPREPESCGATQLCVCGCVALVLGVAPLCGCAAGVCVYAGWSRGKKRGRHYQPALASCQPPCNQRNQPSGTRCNSAGGRRRQGSRCRCVWGGSRGSARGLAVEGESCAE